MSVPASMTLAAGTLTSLADLSTFANGNYSFQTRHGANLVSKEQTLRVSCLVKKSTSLLYPVLSPRAREQSVCCSCSLSVNDLFQKGEKEHQAKAFTSSSKFKLALKDNL